MTKYLFAQIIQEKIVRTKLRYRVRLDRASILVIVDFLTGIAKI